MIFTAVFSLRSTTFGVFGTRRTGGGEDAVQAGRHPPADGRTPETATQRACYSRSMPEVQVRAGLPEEDINVLSGFVSAAFKQTQRPKRAR